MAGTGEGQGLLVDREREITASAEAVRAVHRWRSTALAFVGPAGIGKTSLLRALQDDCRAAGMTVLTSRAAEVERDLPFGIVRQLFEPVLAGMDDQHRGRLFGGPADLARPALALPGSGQPDADSAYAVSHGLYWLTANLAAETPLALIVDDLDWADDPSIGWLGYLLRRLEDLPVLVAVGARLDEPSAAPGVGGLVEDPVTQVVRPAPLGIAAVTALVTDALGIDVSPEFAEECLRATGGNPFYLRELLTTLREEAPSPASGAIAVSGVGPVSIARAVLRRVHRLGARTEDLVAAAAVLGERAPLSHAAQLAGLTVHDAVRAADALIRAHVLVLSGPDLSFAHPIVRSAIYTDLAFSRRSSLHSRAALLLSDHGAPPAQIAGHLMLTVPAGDPVVAETLMTAACEATRRGAPSSAVRLLERALAEPPGDSARAAALRALGVAHAQCGDLNGAAQRLRHALALASEPVTRAHAGRELARVLIATGGAAEAVDVLADVLRALPDEEADLGLQLESTIARAGHFSVEASRRAREQARRFGDRSRPRPGRLLAHDAFEAVITKSASEAARLARQALDGGRLLAEEGPDSQVFYMAANALGLAGHAGEAGCLCAQAMAQARQRGSLRGLCMAAAYRTACLYWSGRLAEAEEDGRTALAHGEHVPGAAAPVAVAYLTMSLTDQGRSDEARTVLDNHRFDERLHQPMALSHRSLAAARLAIAQGDREAAAARLRECGEREEAWPITTPAITQWRAELAALLANTAEQTQGVALAEEELRRCRRFGDNGRLAKALHARALVADGPQRLSYLQEAADLFERSELRLCGAAALKDLGAALRHAGQRKDARSPLRMALDQARRCGATPLAQRAHDELLATGVRERKILRTGTGELTPSERRVAALAAAGKSNREIAQTLVVSVRTVETHLRHIYRKLDVNSRQGIAKVFATPPTPTAPGWRPGSLNPGTSCVPCLSFS